MENRQIIRISKEFLPSCKQFSCSNMALDNYLKNVAYSDTVSFDAATSLVIENEEVVAFFTLNDSYTFDVVDPETNEIKNIFAIEIRYLGVHDDHKNFGIGKQIIQHVFHTCRQLNHRFVYLQSVIPAVKFYERFGFIELELEGTPNEAVSMVADLLDQDVYDAHWNQ